MKKFEKSKNNSMDLFKSLGISSIKFNDLEAIIKQLTALMTP